MLYVIADEYQILCLGTSIVYWAHRAAFTRAGGVNLGLDKTVIIWRGTRGMKWEQLNHTIATYLVKNPPPGFILIQLGSNDLGVSDTRELITQIKCDLLRIGALIPGVKVIWSDILPRRYWHCARTPVALERVRQRVNSCIRAFVLGEGGFVIRHPCISNKEINLYRYDGVHLSP